MSVWLTPELTPVYGGTYFPPTDIYYGQPGFKKLLCIIASQVFCVYHWCMFLRTSTAMTHPPLPQISLPQRTPLSAVLFLNMLSWQWHM